MLLVSELCRAPCRLLARHLFTAMLANFGPLFDDLRTKGAFTGEEAFMNLGNAFIELLLDEVIAYLEAA